MLMMQGQSQLQAEFLQPESTRKMEWPAGYYKAGQHSGRL
jgi:hypothetical protein